MLLRRRAKARGAGGGAGRPAGGRAGGLRRGRRCERLRVAPRAARRNQGGAGTTGLGPQAGGAQPRPAAAAAGLRSKGRAVPPNGERLSSAPGQAGRKVGAETERPPRLEAWRRRRRTGRARRPQASARPCGHRPRGKVATEDPNTAFSKCRRHSALRVLRFSANLQTPSRWILDPAPPAIPSVPKPRAAQRDYTQPARGGTHLGRAADADLDAETPPRKMRLRPARPRAGGAKGPSRSARPRPGPEGSHVPVRKPRNGQGVKRSRSRPPKGTPSATPHPRPASRPPSPRP
ncbi:hypothetical protein GW7_04904 [Heterocephalus glaber]|uniref:Uncharacterized protein n=1 Tax=Heterocephalus glaber TaxID=10181 RepID=G5AP22_HETGA|nr:hypothetical protein GW7_04904 [Heterocephalus glaber]